MSQTFKCPQCDYAVQLTANEAAQVGTPICSECGVECDPIETRPLLDLISALGLEEDALDELVHDAKSGEASNINNGGFTDQVDYLVEALGYADLEKQIRELAS